LFSQKKFDREGAMNDEAQEKKGDVADGAGAGSVIPEEPVRWLQTYPATTTPTVSPSFKFNSPSSQIRK
jgi:hypothetical protein